MNGRWLFGLTAKYAKDAKETLCHRKGVRTRAEYFP